MRRTRLVAQCEPPSSRQYYYNYRNHTHSHTNTYTNTLTITTIIKTKPSRDNSPIQKKNKAPFLCRRDCSNKKTLFLQTHSNQHIQKIIFIIKPSNRWTSDYQQSGQLLLKTRKIIITIMRVTNKQTNKTNVKRLMLKQQQQETTTSSRKQVCCLSNVFVFRF